MIGNLVDVVVDMVVKFRVGVGVERLFSIVLSVVVKINRFTPLGSKVESLTLVVVVKVPMVVEPDIPFTATIPDIDDISVEVVDVANEEGVETCLDFVSLAKSVSGVVNVDTNKGVVLVKLLFVLGLCMS